MERSPEEVLEAIQQAREVGELEGMLEDEPHYVLFAYRLFPNGSTGQLVQDQGIAREIGRKTGLGDPTDPQGWAIWLVQ